MPGPLRYWEDLSEGDVFDLGSATVSAGDIVDFARRWDPQPFHLDPEAAKASLFGGLAASGWHTGSAMMRLMVDNFLHPETSLGSPGLDALRWLAPVRAGDTISVRLRIAGKKESASKPFMGVVFNDWTVVNQRGETVMTVKGVNMFRRRAAAGTAIGGKAAMQAIKGMDHAVVVVRDIRAAERAWRRLGFDVQPEGRHTRLGTVNHLMIFGSDYLELIGVVEPNEFNAERRALLEKGEGLANIALATDGADLARAEWAASGVEPNPVLAFDRPVEIAGRLETASFRTVRIPKAHYPVVGFFVCEHLTPQFVYRAEWTKHPNGVRGLAGAEIVAADPSRLEGLVTRHFGAAKVQRDGDGLAVDTGTQPVRWLTPAAFAARHPGAPLLRADDHPALLALRVADPDVTAVLLRNNGVAHVRTASGGVLVPPTETCGVALEFVRG